MLTSGKLMGAGGAKAPKPELLGTGSYVNNADTYSVTLPVSPQSGDIIIVHQGSQTCPNANVAGGFTSAVFSNYMWAIPTFYNFYITNRVSYKVANGTEGTSIYGFSWTGATYGPAFNNGDTVAVVYRPSFTPSSVTHLNSYSYAAQTGSINDSISYSAATGETIGIASLSTVSTHQDIQMAGDDDFYLSNDALGANPRLIGQSFGVDGEPTSLVPITSTVSEADGLAFGKFYINII